VAIEAPAFGPPNPVAQPNGAHYLVLDIDRVLHPKDADLLRYDWKSLAPYAGQSLGEVLYSA
jgi:hypothetical protein